MRESRKLRISRRRFVAGAAAALAGVLRGAPALATTSGEWRLGDAHAHLFSLPDLPARGFFEHGVAWNTELSTWPVRLLWPAMLDLVEYLKGEAITAEQELEAFRYDPSPEPDIGKPAFERLVFSRIAWMSHRRRTGAIAGSRASGEPLTPPQRRLRTSYRMLATVIEIVGDFDTPLDPADPGASAALSDADIRRIRNAGNNLFRRDCPEAPNAPGAGGGTMDTVNATLDWAREMMQSRQYHLARHRARIADGDLRPTTIVNLLVDYDSWLGDAPAPGSGQDAQIRLWARIREEYGREIDIRTFAGFDPLKDAEEWAGLGARYAAESRFACNQDHVAGGRIHGFKLYPPMGFRPLGNEPSMFAGRARARGVVRRRWRDLDLNLTELPERLDQALVRFYDYCTTNDVPILAHGYHGNEASQCAGAYASPAGWIPVMEAFPDLRLCVGHFAEAGDFDLGMQRRTQGRRIPANVWPLHGTDRLLAFNRNGRSRVYLDIADMIELLNERVGARRAALFFGNLRRYCLDHDPDCRHFMFGSDWIMLGRVRGHARYVSTIRDAMAAADWPEQWQRNLLHDNLRRFLQPGSG